MRAESVHYAQSYRRRITSQKPHLPVEFNQEEIGGMRSAGDSKAKLSLLDRSFALQRTHDERETGKVRIAKEAAMIFNLWISSAMRSRSEA